MAGPAFQLIEDRFSSGDYGISGYGTTPYGGSEFEPYILPKLQVPSDDLSDTKRRLASRITHRRYGAIVGRRTVEIRKRWLVRFDAVGADVIENLLGFFEVGAFRLIPDSDGDAYIDVEWMEDEFKPERLRGPLWNIEFNIEEAGP
jgi:hypothetical protein